MLEVTIAIDAATIRLAGEMDAFAAHQFTDALGFFDGPVTVHLDHLTFIDSSGIHAIVTARRERQVRLVGAQGTVRRVLEISGVEHD